MPIFIISIIIQVFLVLHVVRTGRNTTWIWIVVMVPDMLQLFFFPEEGQEVISIEIRARAKGPLAGGGDGEFGTRRVCPSPCSPNFIFTKEVITVGEK